MYDGIYVGLDIGTTKVTAVVTQAMGSDELVVIGVGQSQCYGLKKGSIVNIETTGEAVLQAINEAELQAGVDIKEVYASISGDHIKSFNKEGDIAVTSRRDREITENDEMRVIEHAQKINLRSDRDIIHVFPQEFIVDDQTGIKSPVGMSGVRLKVKVHIVTGSTNAITNIVKSVNRVGYYIQDIVLSAYASSEAVLSADEKEIGVLVVDIGGGTTDVALYIEGAMQHSFVIPLGGLNVTKDISYGFKTPDAAAEMIKLNYGCASSQIVNPHEVIEVPGVGGRTARKMEKMILTSIIEPRVEEIFSLIYKELYNKNLLKHLSAGVVLTGGTAMMPGIIDIAQKVFSLPARIGHPRGLSDSGLLDTVSRPDCTAAVGLALYGMKHEGETGQDRTNERRVAAGIGMNNFKSKIGEFFKDFFG